MVSRSDVALLRDAQEGVTALVNADLEAFFLSLNLDRPEAAREALLGYLPELIRVHGLSAAAVAADWYDEIREQDGVRGRFRATPMEPQDVAVRCEATVRRTAGYLFTDTPALMLPALIDPATRYVLEPARATITEATVADPAARGWRRYTRAGSCDFCQMLAGRGHVYSSRTATFESHGHCHCVAAPTWV